jgi:hypothetical protein
MRPSMSPSTHRWPSVATSCLRTMNSSTRSESTTSTQPFGRPTVTRSVAFSRVFETPSSGGASKSSSRDRGCAGGRGCCHGGAFAGCTCTCRSMFTRGQGLAGIGPVFPPWMRSVTAPFDLPGVSKSSSPESGGAGGRACCGGRGPSRGARALAARCSRARGTRPRATVR